MANFTPYNKQKKFRYWVQMVLPTIYDDSLSYMELLNKVIHYLNETINGVNILAENIEFLKDYFEDILNDLNDNLKNYVYEYLTEHPEIVVEVKDNLYITMLKNRNAYAGDYINTFGDCMLIHNDNIFGIIDCGYDSEARELIDYINIHNITKLDFIVITHYHTDHTTTNFNAFISNIKRYVDITDTIIFLPHKNINWDAAGITPESGIYLAYENVIATIEENEFTVIEPDDKYIHNFDSIKLKFLNIGVQYYDDYYNWKFDKSGKLTDHCDYNSFSMMVEIQHYDNIILNSADASYITQKLNWKNISSCDVYKIEHHGLNAISNYEWLGSLQPKYSLCGNYSNGYDDSNSFHTTASYLASKGCNMLNTRDGEINLKSNITGIYNINSKAQNKKPSISDLNYFGATLLQPEFFDDDYKTQGKIDLDKFIEIGEFYTNTASKTEDSIYQEKVKGVTLSGKYVKIQNEFINFNPMTLKQTLEIIYPATNFTISRFISYTTEYIDGEVIKTISPRTWYAEGTINLTLDEFCTTNTGFSIISNQSQVTRMGEMIVARLLIESESAFSGIKKPIVINEDYLPTLLLNYGCFIGDQFTVNNPAYLYVRGVSGASTGVVDVRGNENETGRYAKVLMIYKTF